LPDELNNSARLQWQKLEQDIAQGKKLLIVQGCRGCGKSYGARLLVQHMGYEVCVLDLVVDQAELKQTLAKTLGNSILLSEKKRCVQIDDVDDLDAASVELILSAAEGFRGSSLVVLTVTWLWKLRLGRRTKKEWVATCLPMPSFRDVEKAFPLSSCTCNYNQARINHLFNSGCGAIDIERDRFRDARLALTAKALPRVFDENSADVIVASAVNVAQSMREYADFMSIVSETEANRLESYSASSASVFSSFKTHVAILSARTFLDTIGRLKKIHLIVPTFLPTDAGAARQCVWTHSSLKNSPKGKESEKPKRRKSSLA
jgi:hypothetical protein